MTLMCLLLLVHSSDKISMNWSCQNIQNPLWNKAVEVTVLNYITMKPTQHTRDSSRAKWKKERHSKCFRSILSELLAMKFNTYTVFFLGTKIKESLILNGLMCLDLLKYAFKPALRNFIAPDNSIRVENTIF